MTAPGPMIEVAACFRKLDGQKHPFGILAEVMKLRRVLHAHGWSMTDLGQWVEEAARYQEELEFAGGDIGQQMRRDGVSFHQQRT
jgi:hypothetical protein